jgi:hypothetical protein
MKTFVPAARANWARPLALYWRRRRGLRRSSARSAAPPAPATSIVAIHQHFLDARRTVMISAAAAAPVPTAPVNPVSRFSVVERIVTRRLIEARPLDAEVPIATLERLAVVDTRLAASPRATAPPQVARAAALARAGVAPTPSLAGLTQTSAAARIPERVGRQRRKMPRSRLLPQRQPSRRSATATFAAATASTPRLSPLPRRTVLDEVPMAWRRTPPAAAAVASAAPAQIAEQRSTQAVVRPSVTDAGPEPSLTRKMSPGPAVAPNVAFDAPTMERLADNVLRRIERRVRIERERRGL